MGKKNRTKRKDSDTDKRSGLIAWCPLCDSQLKVIHGEQNGMSGAWYYCDAPACGTYMEFIENGQVLPQQGKMDCGYYGGTYHAGIPTSYSGYKGETLGTHVGRVCDHWRVPIRIGDHWITLSAWSDKPKKAADELPYPDVGVYVADIWTRNFGGFMGIGLNIPNKYSALICDWPDYGVVTLDEVRWLVLFIDDCLNNGMDVDIGCHGAHGRTGTLLGCLIAYYEECTSSQAITAVHKRHCAKAIESKGQANLIRAFCGEPEKVKNWCKEWCLYLSGRNTPKPELEASMVEER